MNFYKKNVDIIKNLQLKNGGILATPKDGAYPYVYTRDAVIMTLALNSAGEVEASERYYYFMKKFTKLEKYKEVFQRYNPNGMPCVTRKKENDNEGLLLIGLYDTYMKNKKETFIQNMWPLVENTVKVIENFMCKGLVKTETSIHEFKKLEKGYDIWVNCACCRGLECASKIAEKLNHLEKSKRWKEKSKKIKKRIIEKFYKKNKGFYIKNPSHKNTPDISQLAPFYFEIDKSKIHLKKTMNYLEKHIWDSEIGGFRRFRQFEVCRDWHWYTGGSGSWVVLTAWGAKFYKKLGDKKNYKKCIDWLENVAKKSKGLFPEHIARKEEYDDWKDNEIEFNKRIINETKKSENSVKKMFGKEIVYWATPLGWSHAEYILLKKN